MASLTSIYGDLSGSVAGNTFSRNKGGQYIRQRRAPTNPTTIRQTQVRSKFGTRSGMWTGLSQLQRDSWDSWAALNPVRNTLGTAIQLSGHQAFTGLSSRQLDAGLDPTDDAPVDMAPPGLNSITLNQTATNVELTWAPELESWMNLIIRWTRWQSAGRNPNLNQSVVLQYAQGPAMPILLPLGQAPLATNYYVATVAPDGQISAYLKARIVLAP